MVGDQVGPGHVVADGEQDAGGVVGVFLGCGVEGVLGVDGLFDPHGRLGAEVVVEVVVLDGVALVVLSGDDGDVAVRALGGGVWFDGLGGVEPDLVAVQQAVAVAVADVGAVSAEEGQWEEVVGGEEGGAGVVADRLGGEGDGRAGFVEDLVGPDHVVADGDHEGVARVVGVLGGGGAAGVVGVDGLFEADAGQCALVVVGVVVVDGLAGGGDRSGHGGGVGVEPVADGVCADAGGGV